MVHLRLELIQIQDQDLEPSRVQKNLTISFCITSTFDLQIQDPGETEPSPEPSTPRQAMMS